MPFPYHIRKEQFIYNHYPRWGDIYWYDFGSARAGEHTMAYPHLALVVSDTKITLKGTVLVTPISGAEHRREGYGFHVLLKKADCSRLDKDSIVKIDQVYCVSTKGMPDQYFLTRLEKETMARIYEPLLKVLGVPYVLEFF